MNFGVNQQKRLICRYNLRGMCRFGGRCRNFHENPEKLVENRVEHQEDACTLGACALPSNQPSMSSFGKENICPSKFGPSTSTVEEAISLVRISESKDKICGICFEIILSKVNRLDQRFGILPNCNHCFCFTCINTWRKSKEFDFDVSKACPECRIASDFVYPSRVWLDSKEEKQNFIDSQKQRMKGLDCKYFRKGKGTCPFGNTCLYRHALQNGRILDVGPPKPRRRRRTNSELELEDLLQQWTEHVLETNVLGDSDDSEIDDAFELDLSDPSIAIQYYDKGDIEYYIAMDRLMGGGGLSDDDSDFEFFLS